MRLPDVMRREMVLSGPERAAAIMTAAETTLRLWGADGMDFDELAADIATEARLALAVTAEIKALDTRIAALYHQVDPHGIVRGVPGVGAVGAPQIIGRLGDPTRFANLAAVRSFSGLVPHLDSSGVAARAGGPTKAGDACLREALFLCADHARRIGPTLAARYHRLIIDGGKTPHLSALHDRRRPADQDRSLPPLEHPLRAARHRRHPDHRTPRPTDHQRPLPHPRRHPSQPPTTHHHNPPTPTERAGHVRSRHALRSTARSATSMNPSWPPHNT